MRRAVLLLMAALLIAAAPFDPFGAARIEEHPGAQVPMSLALTDEAGASTTLARLGRGRPLLLVPVLHDCPNLCGVTLDGLAAAMRQARVDSGRDAAVIAFGIDPRETPADARGDLARLTGRHPELAGRIHATIASDAAVHAITGPLGYHFAYDPRIGQVAHAAATAVLTADGRLSRWLYGLAPEPADLTAALAEARAGRTGGWTRRLILLCYHYDPATGRYGVAIDWLLRAGGLAVVVALMLFIVLARRREPVTRC
ncbi:MAG: SCO family protein [Novosphingobium sp.]|nr:SCO family protein [Novosphingobium sp.]